MGENAHDLIVLLLWEELDQTDDEEGAKGRVFIRHLSDTMLNGLGREATIVWDVLV